MLRNARLIFSVLSLPWLAAAVEPLTNNDLIKLSRAGVSQETILRALKAMPHQFDTSPQSLEALRDEGISSDVLFYMTHGFDVQKTGRATAAIPIAEAAGKTLRFSAWIKTQNVYHGYAGIWCRVKDAAGRFIAGEEIQTRMTASQLAQRATGTTDWKNYTFKLRVPAAAQEITFGVGMNGIGKAWFDSLTMEIDGKPYGNHLDLGFEAPAATGFRYSGIGYTLGIDKTVAHSGRQSLQISLVD